ncbi:MAG TPA: type III pantothenate kinase [Phycisphaerae bacterium]|nr:type III pantothenate kinase [Phycisphaerae bacterium]
MSAPADRDRKKPALAPVEQAQLMLLDVGNTRIAAASCVAGERRPAEHCPAHPREGVERMLQKLWDSLSGKRAVVISSVSPPVLAEIRALCESRHIGPLLVVGREIEPPIEADLPEPHKVGTDRLCAAAAGFEKAKQACVIADLGTAVTIDLVADNNIFLGGTILPGMTLAARSLHEHTALLPLVEVGSPTETLGKDTVSAIRNGIFAMMVGALREITERYATRIGKWPILIATGGDAQAIAAGCEFVDHVVPDLCLDGLVIAYRNAAEKDMDDDA